MDRLSGVAVVVLACGLAVFQGGYFPAAVCVFGLASALVYAVLALAGKATLGAPAPAVAFALIALLYGISAFSHGATLTALQQTAWWCALCGMALWCSFDTLAGKQQALDLLCFAGAVLAAAGLLMFFGVLPWEGAVNAGRLMFTFQYANASGVFFAVVAVLALCSGRRVVQASALLPALALVCTKSAGGLAVFALGVLAVGVRWAAVARPSRKVVAGCAVGAAAALLGAVLALSDRLGQAAQTFIERVVQSIDAASLLASCLPLGAGPGSWQYLYPGVQTAQYRAANVHNSYLQVGLDAGVLALALLAAVLVWGVARSARLAQAGSPQGLGAAFASAIGLAMIAVHFLVDFDVAFASIAMLVALLLAPVGSSAEPARKPRASAGFALPAALAIIALALAGSLAGIYLDMRASELRMRCADFDEVAVARLLDSHAFLARDPAMHGEATRMYSRMHEPDHVLGLADPLPCATDTTRLYRALALRDLGSVDEANAQLDALLFGQPYSVELYQAARQLLVDLHADAETVAVFNRNAQRANELALQGHAAWLTGQERIDYLE